MKNKILNYGGIIFFYLAIVLGILYMNYDTNYMQKSTDSIYQTSIIDNK